MELTAKEDIDAPIESVFAELSDFENIERQAMRRGIKVKRTDALPAKAPGMAWDATLAFRGKPRQIALALTGYEPSEELRFSSTSGGIEAETVIDCVALSRGRTRVNMSTVLVPKTLSARLLVQSLKLGKSGIDKRFRKRMTGLARDLENKLKSTA